MIVYLVTNTINGKRYVGQTKQTLSDRWSGHVCKSRCRHLHNAIVKYGKDKFTMEVIVEVPTRELANEFEIEYIKRYNTLSPNGYNLLPGGDDRKNFCTGRKHSEESKQKMRLAKLGKRLSKEHCLKISSSNKGKKRTEETKQKIGLSKLGKHLSEEHKKSLSTSSAHNKWWLGKKFSEEHKKNLSLSHIK